MSNIFAELFEGLGQAIADIRHKLVEEGWFGRQLGDQHTNFNAPSTGDTFWDMPRATFDEQWSPADPTREAEPSQDIHGHDFER